ncbi:MAG: DUF547 domain-containing protein [Hyphomicrobiales bacterium]|nr:DUF547 domain-containing protein [Hyphomicrobiales bacterium]
MQRIVFTLCLLAFAAPAAALTPAHDAALKTYRALLQKHITPRSDGVAGVAYAKWRASAQDRAALDQVVAALAAEKPSQLSRDEAFAYWANLYNAVTLKVVIDAYPIASIKDVKSAGTSFFDVKAYLGPWREKRVTVEGRELSLDDIEHSIMRPTFKDPRVHYAVNCASIGCPDLKPEPWRAETLSADLDAAARAYVNHPRGATVAADGGLTVSSIYSWFQEDFGGDGAGVVAHLTKYAQPALAAKLKGKTGFDRDAYDWTLNEAGK